MVVTCEVPFIVVINPPVLGATRRKYLERHLSTCSGRIPPIKYIGVNKNHLDIRSWNSPMLRDERNLFTRFKLAMGLEKHIIDFKKEYGQYFQVGPRDMPGEKAFCSGTVGVIACAISHIKSWEYVARELKTNQAALITEDDVFLSKHQSFDKVRMPEEADILYQSQMVTQVEEYDGEFVRIKASEAGAYTYFLTGTGARKLCDALLPVPDCRDIDMEMFRKRSLDCNMYKVFAAPKINIHHAMGGKSLVKKESLLHRRLGQKMWQRMSLYWRAFVSK